LTLFILAAACKARLQDGKASESWSQIAKYSFVKNSSHWALFIQEIFPGKYIYLSLMKYLWRSEVFLVLNSIKLWFGSLVVEVEAI